MINAAINAATEFATKHAAFAATEFATNAATDPATFAATSAATELVTYYATYDVGAVATRDATDYAIYATTCDCDATFEAVRAATFEAACAATRGATRTANGEGWRALAADFVGEAWADAALEAARGWTNVYQGGNMWAYLDCYLTAARDILGLRLEPHAAYAYWEQAAIHGGFRWMSPKFCLVSDFPELLLANANNQPHAEFGPSHRWSDGFTTWHLNGVRVEPWMAEQDPDKMDARRIIQVPNLDQRRELIRRMGMERIISRLKPKILDTEEREIGGEYRLLAVDMNHGEPWRFLQMINQSTGATHIEAVPRECETVQHALNWRASQNIDQD